MSWTFNKHKPHTMIELSTLTGACMVALGENTAGLFSNDDNLSTDIIKYGNYNQESFWRLPIFDDHRDSIKGEVADICNSGKTRFLQFIYLIFVKIWRSMYCSCFS